jgi:hypothetical protein
MTAFLADDFLAEQDYHGARAVLISSASSKTSIALAFQLKQGGRARAITLTSARNADFVRGLGYYDEVALYDEIGALRNDEPVVLVDMAGDAAVTAAVHRRFGESLRYHCAIGATHWSAERSSESRPGPKPELFFAPAQIQKRVRDFGPERFTQRLAEAWTKFCDGSDAWLRVVRESGREAAARVYAEVLTGRARPEEGHILSL